MQQKNTNSFLVMFKNLYREKELQTLMKTMFFTCSCGIFLKIEEDFFLIKLKNEFWSIPLFKLLCIRCSKFVSVTQKLLWHATSCLLCSILMHPLVDK